jgi:hypothetical protein
MAVEHKLGDKALLSNGLMVRTTNVLLMIEVFYIWTMMLLKLSLALFFYRLLREKWQKRMITAIVAIFTVFSFAYFWFTVFQCGTPNSGFWFKRYLGECVSSSSILGFGYSHGIISALTDIILAAMPIPMIKNARIPRKEKVIVIGIVALAAV